MEQLPSSTWALPEYQAVRNRLATMGLALPEVPDDLQHDWSLPFVRWVVERTTSGMDCLLQPDDPPGIVVSTHRDIVCDPALYNLARVEAGRPTSHIVLGSNLVRLDWVRGLMEANKAIFVDRSLSGRAALQQQMELSGKLARIVQDGGHVWIAQAPGRAKDGVDATSASLLRMIGLAWGGEEKGPGVLNGIIRPLAIRYDVNPCDAALVKESWTGRKTSEDDERSMLTGLEGWKGRVHMMECPTLDVEAEPDREGWAQWALAVDDAIHGTGLSGQWAHEAETALESGDGSGISTSLRARIEAVGQELEAAGCMRSMPELETALCKVYREVAGVAALGPT